ncbi:MAG: radical SAM protein [Desulfohalobiaceae bacterium]
MNRSANQSGASPTRTANRPQRILLCGVFGPYGVDDAFGRKENVMELFHNQVTKAQGLASLRLHHRTFGLYFMAANVEADVTVLDFPSRRRFLREIRKGYDLVGISFITPNFAKTREMCRLIREEAPDTAIALGGHGAAIEGLEELVDCDHIVQGDGIRWLRSYLGQDPDAPVVHPTLPSNEYRRIMGVPLKGATASLLAPGVGCPNACRFCCTSHFFGKQYLPFVRTGRELFDLARRISQESGSDSFFVMDENFLKEEQRAWDMLRLMEENQRWFRFQIFSSADTVLRFGIPNLVRLGVKLVWIGVESPSGSPFNKNEGIDFPSLVRSLRDHGIGVLTSGILGLEHHDPSTMQEDIDFIINLEPDLIQFMLLTGLPMTELYLELKEAGLLRWDLPFEEWHGQKYLNFRHSRLSGEEAQKWLQFAFDADYQRNGSSMVRLVETALRGTGTMRELARKDEVFQARYEQLLDELEDYRPLLPIMARFAVNERERDKIRDLEKRFQEVLGPKAWRDIGLGILASVCAGVWSWRLRLVGDRIQPRTLVTRYTAPSA